MIPYKMTPIEWVREIRYQTLKLRSFFVRGWRGWSGMDTWSLDHYLARTIGPALRHMAEHAHGHPLWVIEEYNLLDPDDHAVALEAWKSWLIDKAEWFEWYAADEIGFTLDMSAEQKSQLLDFHEKKLDTFKLLVLPDFARHFDSLWD